MSKPWSAINITISPEDGKVKINGGKAVIMEQLDPKQYFSVSVGDYIIEIKRKPSKAATVEKRKRGHYDSGKIIKLGQ